MSESMMNVLELPLRRFDRFQQDHPSLGFPIAVVQKFGNDRASAFAARIAYQGLFSVFPLLLVFTTVLAFVLEDRAELRRDILDSALSDFPIIGTELRRTSKPLDGSGVALAIGIAGSVYGGLGVGQSAMAAMNTVWDIPREHWPNFLFRRLRSLAVVATIGVGAVASTVASGIVASLGEGAARPLGVLATFVVDFLLFVIAFMVLTALPLGWRDVRLGAALAAVFWGALKLEGFWYVSRILTTATDVYGFFAVVIALLSWMYAAAQLTLLAAEINVVSKHRLWPRSLTQPPLTDADRRVFTRLASTTKRRPEYVVEVRFLDVADHDPLEPHSRTPP